LDLLPIRPRVLLPPAPLLGHHLGPHGVRGLQDLPLPVGPVREPERLVQGFAGTNPQPVDPNTQHPARREGGGVACLASETRPYVGGSPAGTTPRGCCRPPAARR